MTAVIQDVGLQTTRPSTGLKQKLLAFINGHDPNWTILEIIEWWRNPTKKKLNLFNSYLYILWLQDELYGPVESKQSEIKLPDAENKH